MEHNNDIDDLFQQSFESFEVPPPEELKKKIDEQLNFKERKRRFFGFWLFAGIALTGCALLATLWLAAPTGKEDGKMLSSSQESNTGTTNRAHQSPDGSRKSKTAYSPSRKAKKQHQETYSSGQESADDIQTGRNSTDTKPNPAESKASSRAGKASGNKGAGQERTKKNRQKSETLSYLASGQEQANTGNAGEEKKPEREAENNPDQQDTAKEKEKGTTAGEADSLAAAKQAALVQKDDSSENDSLAKNYVQPERKKPEPAAMSPFLVGVQFGLTRGLNRSDETVTFGESSPFYLNFDASYTFRKIGLSSGINYFTTSESVSHTYTSLDSVVVGISYNYFTIDSTIYLYDSNQVIIDSINYTILDSTAVNNYELSTNSHTESSVYRVSYFSLPFMLSYHQRLGGKFYLDLMAGGVISYQKLRFRESNPVNDNVTLSELGFRLCVKTNLRYQFSKFGVSLNSNFSYDMKPVQFQQTSRKRQALDFGVGLWYNF